MPLLNNEFSLMAASSLIGCINIIETKYEGNILAALIIIWFEIHITLEGHILEDLIFRDMNMIGGIIHHWGWYEPYVIAFPIFYLIQSLYFGNIFRNEPNIESPF